jgi:hypothetical protein
MVRVNSKIEEYIRLADSWVAAMRDEDPDLANSIHDQIQSVFCGISSLGQEDALFSRLESANEAAKFFIASHLKHKDAAKARGLYRQLSRSSDPFISISAEYILKELGK